MMDYSIQKMVTTRVWKGKRKGGGGVVPTLDHNIHVMLIQSRRRANIKGVMMDSTSEVKRSQLKKMEEE